tara:strand:- start:140 stop:265 length:126 start_codon:yes stop_codon:yes gene_type:complete
MRLAELAAVFKFERLGVTADSVFRFFARSAFCVICLLATLI